MQKWKTSIELEIITVLWKEKEKEKTEKEGRMTEWNCGNILCTFHQLLYLA